MEPIRVLIVEDHPATLLGLHTILAVDKRFQTVGIAKNGHDALDQLSRHESIGLVCLDLGLPGEMDGYDVCKAVKVQDESLPVVVFTGQEEPGVASRARAAGAVGIVSKSERHQELTKALWLAHGGRPYTSPRFAATSDLPELTSRQRQVLRLLAGGLDNKAIAQELDIGDETVKTHVRALLSKLEANHRTQAVAIGLRNSLI